MNWWDAPEYDSVRMFYPDPDPNARMERLRIAVDTTDQPKNEQRPYETVRVYRGACRAT